TQGRRRRRRYGYRRRLFPAAVDYCLPRSCAPSRAVRAAPIPGRRGGLGRRPACGRLEGSNRYRRCTGSRSGARDGRKAGVEHTPAQRERMMGRALGIYRETEFSPGKVAADAAILDSVLANLAAQGLEISALAARDFINNPLPRCDLIL